MLKQLIHEKINEVIAEYQKANGITSGDISVADQLDLDSIANYLEAAVERICEKQQKAIIEDLTPSWYIYTDSEGVTHSETFGQIDIDHFFTKVSKRICFDDCTDETVQKIYYKGKEVYYTGWQQGMKFEYKDLDGNTIWVGQFEHWNH